MFDVIRVNRRDPELHRYLSSVLAGGYHRIEWQDPDVDCTELYQHVGGAVVRGRCSVLEALAPWLADAPPYRGMSGLGTAAQHIAARAVLMGAFAKEHQAPRRQALQYAQAVTHLETAYGLGWKGAMVGSHNWGAVQCVAGNAPCIAYQDSNPDGSHYPVSFRSYPTDVDGAADAVRHVLELRPRVAAELRRARPSVMRASYAMRRERYYGGFCPQAAAKYGAAVAKASFADPDRDDGTRACAREAIEAHAHAIWSRVQEIAAANNEPAALELGTYDDADRWWHGGASSWRRALFGLGVSAAAGGAVYWLVRARGWR